MEEKVKKLRSLSEIFNELEIDIKSSHFSRFPVRFILIDDPVSWNEIVKFLRNIADIHIKLSDYCKGEDSYPNLNKGVTEAIKFSKDGKKVLLIPLSEVLRIESFDIVKSKLSRLIELQADPSKNGRLYIPLYCFKTHFFEIWNEHFDIHRLYPPIIFQNEAEKVLNIWVAKEKDFFEFLKQSSKIDLKVNFMHGFRSMLKTWENGTLSGDILVYSNLLYNLVSQVVGGVKITRIKNYKSLLENIFAIDVPIPYLEEENKFWKDLTTQILSLGCNTLGEFAKKELNVNKFSKEIFYRWEDLEEFDRWLLYYWGKIEVANEGTYLYYVLQGSQNFYEFEKKIWLSVLDIQEITTSLLKERVELIKKMRIDPPTDFFYELEKIKDPIRKLRILTGTTEAEKLEIIRCVSHYLKEAKNLEKDMIQLIEIIFPELYYYMTIPPLENKKLEEYLREYIYAKIRDSPTETIFNLSEEFAKSNLILNFPARNARIEKLSTSLILWVDGIGIEWIGLLYGILRDRHNDCEVTFEIVRANLPTTTEFNPTSSNIKDKEFCLDKIFHEHEYKFPESILKEFECIRKIIRKIEFILKTNNEVIITSDHGSTRFAGWLSEKIAKPSEAEPERNGRYIIAPNEPPDSDEYYVEKYNGNYYLISKLHKNFEGGKKVPGENHGGATVEEALIPIFKISKTKPIKPIIEIQSKKINLLKPLLKIKVRPSVNRVEMRILGKILQGKQLDNENWEFNLKSLRLSPGEYKVTFYLPTGSEEKVITIKGGMEEEELL